jgi:hypothetical protein
VTDALVDGLEAEEVLFFHGCVDCSSFFAMFWSSQQESNIEGSTFPNEHHWLNA